MVARSALKELVENATYAGGETDPDGDCIQYRLKGALMSVYLTDTYGDDVPEDDEVIRTAEAVGIGEGPVPRWEALPVTDDDEGTWRGYKPVRMSGSSMTVSITEGCHALGISRGEYVEVKIKKA